MRSALASFSRSAALAAWPMIAVGLACSSPPPSTSLTLELTASSAVDVLVISVRDGTGHEARRLDVRVARSAEELAARPERIEIDVPLGAVEVHLSDMDAGLAASRCYEVTGPLEDDVHMVALDALLDADGDGWPADAEAHCRDLGPSGALIACDLGVCLGSAAQDCDDEEAAVFPGAPTICQNGIDENCRDEGLAAGDEPCGDRDGDGFPACAAASTPGSCDCDDVDAASFPGAPEPCGELRDRDCDGRARACDADGDGFAEDDCDDGDASVRPGADDVCGDGIDQDCNLRIDDGPSCLDLDLDRDGFDRCEGARDCSVCDCDDCNGGVRPGAEEVCDGIDQETGEAVPATGDPYPDCPGDPDGDGNVGARDCDEGNRDAHAGAAENCLTPELESCLVTGVCSGIDGDGDGFAAAEDCNDDDDAVHPGASETCNAVDDDCDGVLDEVSSSGVGCVGGAASCGTSERCTVDYRSDALHCGGCGVRCEDGETCLAGSCVG